MNKNSTMLMVHWDEKTGSISLVAAAAVWKKKYPADN